MVLQNSMTKFELFTLDKFASPTLNRKVTKDYLYAECSAGLEELVYQHARYMIPPNVYCRAPTSAQDFVTQLSIILSPDATNVISENLSSFDSIAGIQCSEAFIAERSIGSWLHFIIKSVFASAAEV
jgi:hypothetical protein